MFMRAMVLTHPAARNVEAVTRPVPTAGPGQLLIHVHACGVCRTDLHVVDGELPNPSIPVVPGHEIVGHVEAVGAGAEFQVGERVGVPWLGYTDGECAYCRSGRENLCPHARFTGYQIDGGYSDFAVVDQRFCFALPVGTSDLE